MRRIKSAILLTAMAATVLVSIGQPLRAQATQITDTGDAIVTGVAVTSSEGATATEAGESGLVPAPAAGDQAKFLRGDGTWAEVPGVTDISDLQATVKVLVGEDSNKSARTIAAEEVAKIVSGAPEAYDTLKEIADWIQSHPDDVAALNTRLTTVEGNITLIQQEVGDLTTSLNELTTRVSAAETNISELDNRLKWWELSD